MTSRRDVRRGRKCRRTLRTTTTIALYIFVLKSSLRRFSNLIKCSLKWIIRSHSIYLFSVLFYLSFAYRFIDSWNGLFGKMNSNNQKCSSKTLQKWKVTNKAILKWENNQIGRKSKQEKKSRWSVSGARTELQFHELALVLETQVVLLILNTPN